MLPPRFKESARPDTDGAVRLTDTDAALARLSAVHKHYLTDPFIRHFVPRAHLQPPRPPLINIGTYVRSEGIDKLVEAWFSFTEQEGTQCQVVSLGAGSDTRFWRISTGPRKDLLRAYFEIDFAEITTKKAMAIRKSKELSVVLGKPEDIKIANGGTSLHAPKYHLLAGDLRQPPSDLLALLEPHLSPMYPTLLLFECVLVYISPQASSALIQGFVDFFERGAAVQGGHGVLGGIVYEMYGLEDSFGKVMKSNLMARNVSLPGADPYPTQASLSTRFLQHGFTIAKALTLRDIRRSYVDPAEQERISHLEMLDEIEELELVLGHYAITWGVKLPASATIKADWATWDLKPYSASRDEED
ncbi:leucine carboxyl methyltransferase [Daedalea quercina L-15889]|uniref:Leucine carboxyl methyltransferase 1 n=1 Tax=Daedalea quercina L-15889 TaxID=1314783 RepID=A0A165SNS2_9APHY|nr:leucine carboxyl methyltransferase [Daedalea quercina L-15889]